MTLGWHCATCGTWGTIPIPPDTHRELHCSLHDVGGALDLALAEHHRQTPRCSQRVAQVIVEFAEGGVA